MPASSCTSKRTEAHEFYRNRLQRSGTSPAFASPLGNLSPATKRIDRCSTPAWPTWPSRDSCVRRKMADRSTTRFLRVVRWCEAGAVFVTESLNSSLCLCLSLVSLVTFLFCSLSFSSCLCVYLKLGDTCGLSLRTGIACAFKHVSFLTRLLFKRPASKIAPSTVS